MLLTFLSGWTTAQSMQDYQQIALEQNPEVQGKYKAFESALTKVDQVNTLPDPNLSFGVFISPVETRVGPQRARLSLSQMFPWFGTLEARGDVAALNAEAAFQQFVDAQNQLSFEVARAYFPLSELGQLVEIHEANLDLLQTWKKLATRQYESGKTKLADVLRLDLAIQETQVELDVLLDRREPLEVTFNRLLNRSDTTAISLPDGTSDLSRQLPAKDTTWANHPRLLELEKRMAASRKEKDVIRKQGLPKLGAGLDYVLVGERTDLAPGATVEDDGRDALMPMVSVSIPIFRRKYTAQLKETDLTIDRYEHSVTGVKNELSTKYENLRFEWERALSLIDLYEQQMAKTEQIQSLLLSDFVNGGQGLDELLRVQLQLLNYQLKAVETETKLKTIAANLDFVLGTRTDQ